MNVALMFLPGLAEHHNIIYEGGAAVLKTSQYSVHKPLERGWGTMQVKGHPRQREEAKRGPECSGELRLALKKNLRPAHVQSGDVVGPLNLLPQVLCSSTL